MRKILFLVLLALLANQAAKGQEDRIILPYTRAVPAQVYAPAQLVYNPQTGTFHALANGVDQNLSTSGGVPSQQVAPNPGTVTASQYCGSQSNCHSIVPDGRMVRDGVWTSTSTTVTSATANFTQADVGKAIFGYAKCNSAIPSQAATLGASLTTISSINSSTSVTVSVAATGTVSSAGCLEIGSMNDIGLAAMDTAAQSNPQCPTLEFPQGDILIASSHFTTQMAGCTLAGLTGGYAAGGGARFVGTGQWQTRFVMVPWFDPTTCPANANFTGSPKVCFAGIPSSEWENIGITGIGGSQLGGSSSIVLFGWATQSVLKHVTLSDYGTSNTVNVVGVQSQSGGYGMEAFHLMIDAFGGKSCLLASGAVILRDESNIEDCQGNTGANGADVDIPSGGGIDSVGTGYGGTPLNGVNAILVRNAGTYTAVRDYTFPNGVTAAVNAFKNVSTGSMTCVLCTFGANGATTFSFYNNGGTAFFQSSTINQFGQDTSATAWDGGNNSWITSWSNSSGTFHHTESGVCTFAATTTCAITFTHAFGAAPVLTITPIVPGAITVTVTTGPSSTGATLTASASTSISVGWVATL